LHHSSKRCSPKGIKGQEQKVLKVPMLRILF
jgi:hypothetical protein